MTALAAATAPALSWLLLHQGRRCCRRYGMALPPLLAPATTLASWFVALPVRADTNLAALAGAVVVACAVVSAATDACTGYVFDRVLLVAAAALLAIALSAGTVGAVLCGATAGALCLTPLPLLTGGRAMGWGDVKLAGVLGAGLGWKGALCAIWIACVAGGAVAAIRLMTRSVRRDSELRFGPYLAAGAICVCVTGVRW